MASSQSPSFSQPFTFSGDIDTSTLGGFFETMSDNAGNKPTGTFTGTFEPIGGASLLSKFPTTSTTLTTSATPNTPTTTSASTASTADGAASSSSSPTPATSLSDTVASSASGTDIASSSSAANNATASKETSAGLSTGTQAAIAVPIVVVAIALIVLALLCIRRRKKQQKETGDSIEKVPLAAKKKKWTRHLRIFSFDSELLMGGRYSSTNSIRSGQTGSVRSQASSRHSHGPSLHSIDEIAPPYRDAVTSAQPPSIGQVMAGPVASGGVSRSASGATAPPPYGAAPGRISTPTTPRATHATQNPFADSPPVSPVEGSPFNDPPGASPPISRNSSMYRNDRDDASSIGGASEAASIRQATLARNASVASGGRVINNMTRS